MAEKVTFMKLKVDLECEKCYKKVKKLLGKYPQIRDQKYDEKGNMVAIMVVCCSPEKIRDKLCYKGGGSIKSIEIVDPPKPKPAEPEKKKEPEKPKAAEPEKKKDGDKPKPAKEAEKPKTAEPEKKKDSDKPKDAEKPKPKPEGEKPKEKPEGEKPKDKPATAASMQMIPQMPPPMAVPVGMCYVPSCYEGRPVVPYGSAYPQQYGGPVQYYDGYYARPVYDSYGGSGPCYVGRCDQYLSEENATGCTIM
ncbi:unnamed protein product [Lathyrus oleraceus]|uniref:Uncharacterized protein n=1 Tax=Pisum sativum TaxID=3888 RepID=A0A9D5BNU2_PEA|nr:protein PYRICULARIA ORYZAE RESISTANCE 21-like [Pisum sativum]KAI5447024.1 hypothetical protein KIW84_014752 [Pisum sativum]